MGDNLTGGPSLIFHRRLLKNLSLIRGGAEMVKAVLGFDANTLYLWATSCAMPMGFPQIYRLNKATERLELAFDPDVSGKQTA